MFRGAAGFSGSSLPKTSEIFTSAGFCSFNPPTSRYSVEEVGRTPPPQDMNRSVDPLSSLQSDITTVGNLDYIEPFESLFRSALMIQCSNSVEIPGKLSSCEQGSEPGTFW